MVDESDRVWVNIDNIRMTQGDHWFSIIGVGDMTEQTGNEYDTYEECVREDIPNGFRVKYNNKNPNGKHQRVYTDVPLSPPPPTYEEGGSEGHSKRVFGDLGRARRGATEVCGPCDVHEPPMVHAVAQRS